MIELKNVTKRYGEKIAVDNLSLSIGRGEIVGFLGRNGAGKSTTLNMMTGYISMSSGSITIDGYDIEQNPLEAKRRIGYLPEMPPLYVDMTVEEYLRFCCGIKGVRRAYVKKHISDVTELTGLGEVRGRLIRNLSKGYRQRTGVAQALIGNPEIIILDEPTSGLDPSQIVELRDIITEIGKTQTVVFSSHILSEVSDVCQRVVIINEGRLAVDDTLSNLTGGNGRKLLLRVAGEMQVVEEALSAVSGVRSVRISGADSYILDVDHGDEVCGRIFFAMSALSFPIFRMEEMGDSMESIFLRYTMESADRRKED